MKVFVKKAVVIAFVVAMVMTVSIGMARSQNYVADAFTTDFEAGSLQGWTKTGDAFDFQPTKGDNPTARNRGQPSNHEGDWWIGTYEKYQGKPGQKAGDVQGDGPKGTLTSAPFVVTGEKINFLIGGGNNLGDPAGATAVILEINGKIVRESTGKNHETMKRAEWDVAKFKGELAVIRIIDDNSGGWGHINCDDFNMIDSTGKELPFSEPPSDRSLDEEEMEEDLSKPGLVVVMNDDDNDGDQVPDFADGFNLDSVWDNDDDINPTQQFVPLLVEIPSEIDLEQARIRVTYSASNPADTMIVQEEPLVYEPAPGALRIWAQPSDMERNPEQIADGGDFVAPSEYSPEQLGLTNRNRMVTWYVEGIQTSRNLADQEIIIEVDAKNGMSKDVVRVTVIDFQFTTQGPDGELVDQQYTFNSVPAPELQVVVQNCQMDDNGLVTLNLTGSVIDFASGLVPDPNRQLQQITISPQNQETYVIDLQNSADPEPPWQPYRFESSFSASVELQTHNDSGEYWVSVSTGENPAGVAANLMLFVIHNENEAFCVEEAATEPGSFMPTIIRIDAPPRTFEESESFISVFDADWAIDSRDLGDGQFLYAVDMKGNIAVFLPALYASSIDPYVTMKPLDLSLNAQIKINKEFLAGAKLVWKVSGLRIQNDDISVSHLGKIDNYGQLSFKTTYAAGDVTEYIYAPNAGGARNLDNSLNTEILYRYINFGDTIVDFASKAELDKDVKHRLKVVDTVKNEQLGFPNPPSFPVKFNSVFWLNNVKVKGGKSAAAAVKDIFAKPQTFKYYMGCALGAAYSVDTGAIEALGNQEFDKRVGQYPSPTFPGFPYGKAFKVLKSDIVKGVGDEKHVKWIPGDWGYITNPQTNPQAYHEGENIVYVGGQAGTIAVGNFDLQFKDFYKNAIFWGHGGGQKTLEQWYIEVDGWYTPKKAVIETSRIRLRQKP